MKTAVVGGVFRDLFSDVHRMDVRFCAVHAL